MIKAFFIRLFCKHEYEFYRNIYGDEIIHAGFNRSDWKCSRCGKLQLRPELNKQRNK